MKYTFRFQQEVWRHFLSVAKERRHATASIRVPSLFSFWKRPFKRESCSGEKNRTCPENESLCQIPSVPLHPAWWSRPCSCFSMANASSASLDLAPSVDGADHWQSDTSSPWVSLGWYHPGLQRCLHLQAMLQICTKFEIQKVQKPHRISIHQACSTNCT